MRHWLKLLQITLLPIQQLETSINLDQKMYVHILFLLLKRLFVNL